MLVEPTMVEPAPLWENCRPGIGFRPTDEELVNYYLKHKLKADDPSIHSIIAEIDILKYEPWDLPAFSAIKSNDQEWFFFSPFYYRYRNSNRSKRTTPRGFWKATGKEREIIDPDTDRTIGTKKCLVFHEGRVPNGRNTNWVIHEYHDLTLPTEQRTHVLCKLIKKRGKKVERKTYQPVSDDREPSSHTVSEDENPEDHCLLNFDSVNQTLLESDESSDFGIQTPLNLDELVNTMIQIPFNSDEFLNSMVQTPLNPEFLNLTTPYGSFEFLDSSSETLLKSYESELHLLLREDEQELFKNDNSI